MEGKNKRNNIVVFIIILLVIVPLLIFGKNKAEKGNSSQILQQYFEVKDKGGIYEQREFVYKNVKRLSEKDATVLMSDYLYDLEVKTISLYNIAGYLKDELQMYEGLDLSTDYKNIENKIVKGLFEEAAQLDVKTIKVGGYYDFFINIDEIYKKIGSTVKPDFKELSLLIADVAFENPLDNNYEIDMTRIVNKLENIYNLIEEYPNSDYLDSFNNLKYKYYSLIFGLNHESYFSDIDNKMYDVEHLNVIVDLSKSIDNKKFKDDISNVLGLIQKNNNSLNDLISKQIEDL